MRQIDSFAEHVASRYNDWDSRRNEMETQWERWFRTYRVQPATDDREYNSEISELKTPITKINTDTAVDNIMTIIFSRDPWFDIRGRQLSDGVNAQTLAAYMDYLFDHQNFFNEWNKFVFEMCLYGTGVGMVEVKQDVRQTVITEGATLSDDGAPIAFTAEVVAESKIVNQPRFKHISLYDFFIDPSATDIQTAEGVIVQSYVKKHKLHEMERNGVITGVEIVDMDKSVGDGQNIDDERQDQLNRSGLSADGNPDDIQVFEWWGWADEETLLKAGYEGEIEDGGAEVRALIANQSITLLLTPNPHVSGRRPFVKDNYQELPGHFYGLGIAEACDSSQRASDATVRQRIDNKNIAINNIFGIDSAALIPGQDLEIKPNKVFLTNGPPRNALEQFAVEDVTRYTYRDAQEYERYAREASKMNPSRIGAQVSKEQSATEAQIAFEASSVPLRQTVNSTEKNSLKDILRWYYEIILQFLNEEEIVLVTDEASKKLLEASITPESISGDYDFEPMGVPTITRRAELAKTMNLLQMTANPVDMAIANRPAMLKDVAELLLGAEKAAAYINALSPEQMAVIAAQLPNIGSSATQAEPQGPMEGQAI